MILRVAICILGLVTFESASGQVWVKTGAPSNYWSAVTCSADGMIVLAATAPVRAGPIYISTNSGANWSVTGAPILNWYSVACSADGTKFIAAAYGNGIYTSGDTGVTWTSNNIPP